LVFIGISTTWLSVTAFMCDDLVFV
jgi:hypothetical protein